MTATEPGTLMWIGKRDGPFSEAYQFCLDHAPQVALRAHCHQALERRAMGVRGIVLARVDRAPISPLALQRLKRRYSAAQCVHLLGPLATGLRSGDQLPANERLEWHGWRERLTDWLRHWGSAELDPSRCHRSVIVVASNFQSAAPLLDLAAATGSTTVWMRNFEGPQVKNFDAVWWDDSVGTATSAAGWHDRMRRIAAARPDAEHVWIANRPTPQQCDEARGAGVAQIHQKPFAIDALLRSLAASPSRSELRVA